MHLRSSPAFSMGTSKRITLERRPDEVPGPAAYSTNVIPRYNSPRAVFPRAAKLTLESQSSSPGPGNYLPKYLMGEGPKAVLTPRRTSQPSQASLSPGPNDYSPKPIDTSKAFSFAGRYTHPTEAGEMPGPGTYSPLCTETVPSIV